MIGKGHVLGRASNPMDSLRTMADCAKAAPGSSGRIVNAAVRGLVLGLNRGEGTLTLPSLRNGLREAVRASEQVLRDAYGETPNPGGLVYALVQARDAVDNCQHLAQVPKAMAEAVRPLASVDRGSAALSLFLDGFAGIPVEIPPPPAPRPRVLRGVYDGCMGHIPVKPNRVQRLVAKAVSERWSMPIYYDRSLESYLLHVKRKWTRYNKWKGGLEHIEGIITIPGSLAGVVVTARGERNFFDPHAEMRIEPMEDSTLGEREILEWLESESWVKDAVPAHDEWQGAGESNPSSHLLQRQTGPPGPHPPLTIVTVLKSGGDYLQSHVKKLQRACERLMPQHRFVCVSDTEVPDCEVIPMKYDFPKWWGVTEAFAVPGPALYMDLDTILVGNCTSIIEAAKGKDFVILRDFLSGGNHFGGGVMYWEADMSFVLKELVENPRHNTFKGRNDVWYEKVIPMDMVTFWQDITGGIVSFKVHVMKNRLKGHEKIVCFHGPPRPWAQHVIPY